MRIMVTLCFAAFFMGCAGKYVRVGGMSCPQGYSQDRIDQDMRECRFYGESEQEAAQKASFPQEVGPECIQCLEAKGYQITE